MQNPELSPSARAIAALATEKHEEALREALSLSDPELQAFLALCATTDEGTRAALARRLAHLALISGDFEAAALALCSLGDEDEALRRQLAAAFAKDSPRLSKDSVPEPPPLARPTAATGTLEELEKRAAALGMDLPKLPAKPRSIAPARVFSELETDALLGLLRAFEVRVVDVGTELLVEGEEGHDAYFLAYGTCTVETKRHGRTGELGPGQIFGEIALLARSPRVASVVAATPVVVLVASRHSLEVAASEAPRIAEVLAQTTLRRVLESVSRSSGLLLTMDSAEKRRFLSLFELRSFEQGETLVQQHDPPKGLFLVASGFVVVHRREDDENLVLKRLAPGDVFGEIALVLRRRAVADVTADTPCLCLFLAEARFLQLIQEHPLVLRHLYLTALARDAETERARVDEAADAEPYVLV